MTDPFESLFDTLDVLDGKRRKLWHECRDAKGNLVGVHPLAVSPRDAAAVEAWQQRCQEVHADQVMVLPPEKPGAPLRNVPVAEQEGPIPFEDSDDSKRMRSLNRGD